MNRNKQPFPTYLQDDDAGQPAVNPPESTLRADIIRSIKLLSNAAVANAARVHHLSIIVESMVNGEMERTADDIVKEVDECASRAAAELSAVKGTYAQRFEAIEQFLLASNDIMVAVTNKL